MSRELEALEFLQAFINPEESWPDYLDLLKAFGIIEDALKDYEELKIANSKQFKEKWVQDNLAMTFELNAANKKLRALDFLKNNLNIEFEIKDNRCFIILKFDGFYAQQEIPKQEFDLLKEVLLCEQ